MARTPAQTTLDAVIDRGLTPVLVAAGYRKRAHTLRRVGARCVQVVNVQASRSSTAQTVRFTINLGVLHPEVGVFGETVFGPCPDPARVDVPQCHLRARIGSLMPGGGDRWWTIDAGAPIDVLAGELEAALRADGLPWLTAMADFDLARRASERQGMIGAMFALAAGDRAAAAALVDALLRERPHAVAVSGWARTHGLIP